MTDVMALARELTPKLEAAREASPLPRHADVARAERVLRAVARRGRAPCLRRRAGAVGRAMHLHRRRRASTD